MIFVQQFVLTAFQQNTRIVGCHKAREAICVDPGERSDELVKFLRNNGLKLRAIVLTHGHLDHVGGTSFLSGEFPDAEIILHKNDEDLYYGLPQQPLFLGIQPQQLKALGLNYEDPPRITRNWEHGEEYAVGELRFSIRHCPGHTPGHVILAELAQKMVFVGDCLFQGSIGRTDLPGGSYDQLIESIADQIMSLGDEFVVYSGHGPETTIGKERISNPFLNGSVSLRAGRFI